MTVIGIRQSQVVTTYGPGSLVDLPEHAVMVAGLEHWRGKTTLILEPRLLANLRRRLKIPHLELRAPPVLQKEDERGKIGLVAWQFPEWFVAQYEVVTREHGRSRPLLHRTALVKAKYQTEEKGKKKNWPVVPVRFVQGCPNGHISDIDWPALVHADGIPCAGEYWLDEKGTTGDLTDLSIHCEICKRKLSMAQLQLIGNENPLLGDCRGERPWIGPAAREKCASENSLPHKNRLLIRSASNAYFPLIERAISIPDNDEKLRKAVEAVWEDYLKEAEELDDVTRDRKKKERVKKALEGHTDEAVWAECCRRKNGDPGEAKTLKDVECETFLSAPEELGEDVAEGDFYARRIPLPDPTPAILGPIDRIVLAHRLREVVTEVGFTRFESPTQPVDAELALGVQVASLAQDVQWLPAVENRGEGIFLSLNADSVQKWISRPAVKKRAKQVAQGLRATQKYEVDDDVVEEVYMPYMLLHSLSHLLLTAVSLECGYAAASIRERIYVRSESYGLLLYTGTPDAEGTLGGLVEVGRRLDRHLRTALELGSLCSNDPVCAQHRPDQVHEGRVLHGAACHGCLLIAESSCERRNELLDRSLVVPTVDTADLAFFPAP